MYIELLIYGLSFITCHLVFLEFEFSNLKAIQHFQKLIGSEFKRNPKDLPLIRKLLISDKYESEL